MWGQLPALQRLHHHGAQLNAMLRDTGPSAAARNDEYLVAACLRGQTDVVKYLLRDGGLSVAPPLASAATATARSPAPSPLEAAAQNGHLDTVRVLVEVGGADVNRAEAGRGVPLLKAAEAGHLEVCRYLVAAGADVNSRASSCTGSALFAACQENRLAVVRYLVLEAGADVELGRGLFRGSCVTPLVGACERRAVEVVRFLVTEGGAEVDRVAYNGQTALYIACELGCLGAVQALVQLGKADVNRPEILFGMTPLYIACRSAHEDVVRFLLIRARAKVNLGRTDYRFSPFHIACSFGHLTIAQLLAASGANTEAPTLVGSTPRQLATQRDHQPILRWLDTVKGWSRLQIALDGRLPDIVLQRIAVDCLSDPFEIAVGTPSIHTLATTVREYPNAPAVDEATIMAFRLIRKPCSRSTVTLFGAQFRRALFTVLLCAARSNKRLRGGGTVGSLSWEMWSHVISFLRRGDFAHFHFAEQLEIPSAPAHASDNCSP